MVLASVYVHRESRELAISGKASRVQPPPTFHRGLHLDRGPTRARSYLEYVTVRDRPGLRYRGILMNPSVFLPLPSAVSSPMPYYADPTVV